MSTKDTEQVEVNADYFEQLSKIEATFYQFSARYTNLGLEMRSIENNMAAINTHKSNILKAMIEDAGLKWDPAKFEYQVAVEDSTPILKVIHKELMDE